MRDDFLSRDWAEGHGTFSDGIDRFFASLRTAFEKLNRHQFDAPWKHTDCDAKN